MQGSTVSITGNDTLLINGRNLVNLGDADNGVLTHPNDLMTVKTGKNGNTIYSFNAPGQQAELVIRIMRGSPDDRFLNSLLQGMIADPSGFTLLTGKFIKRVGDGRGNVTNDTYLLTGGVFFKQVDAKSNAEGDTEQSIAVYQLRFGSNPRAIL
jgi:hypothetical protein